jgi:hypothetical protein
MSSTAAAGPSSRSRRHASAGAGEIDQHGAHALAAAEHRVAHGLVQPARLAGAGSQRSRQRSTRAPQAASRSAGSLPGSNGSSSASVASRERISTFCSAARSAAWQRRVSATPRSKAASACSSGWSPARVRPRAARLKGSKTEHNLKEAFAGESQANRRYLYFAAKADVEGYNDVAAVFRSTAEGETGHAHGHLEYLEAVGDPATGLPIGGTGDNLKARSPARPTSTPTCTRAWPRPRATRASTRSPTGSRRWPRPSAPRQPLPEGAGQPRRLSPGRPGAAAPGRSAAPGGRCRREGPHSPAAAALQEWQARCPSNPPPRRQPRGADPPPGRLEVPGVLRRGKAVQGTGARVRHLSRLPALLQPVQLLPDPVRRGRRVRHRELDGVAARGLLGGRRPLLPVRHVLHDQVSLRAAARVERRLPAPDAARQGRALPEGQGASRATAS